MGYPSVVMLRCVRPCLASTLPLRRLLMGLTKEAAMLGEGSKGQETAGSIRELYGLSELRTAAICSEKLGPSVLPPQGNGFCHQS